MSSCTEGAFLLFNDIYVDIKLLLSASDIIQLEIHVETNGNFSLYSPVILGSQPSIKTKKRKKCFYFIMHSNSNQSTPSLLLNYHCDNVKSAK